MQPSALDPILSLIPLETHGSPAAAAPRDAKGGASFAEHLQTPPRKESESSPVPAATASSRSSDKEPRTAATGDGNTKPAARSEEREASPSNAAAASDADDQREKPPEGAVAEASGAEKSPTAEDDPNEEIEQDDSSDELLLTAAVQPPVEPVPPEVKSSAEDEAATDAPLAEGLSDEGKPAPAKAQAKPAGLPGEAQPSVPQDAQAEMPEAEATTEAPAAESLSDAAAEVIAKEPTFEKTTADKDAPEAKEPASESEHRPADEQALAAEAVDPVATNARDGKKERKRGEPSQRVNAAGDKPSAGVTENKGSAPATPAAAAAATVTDAALAPPDPSAASPSAPPPTAMPTPSVGAELQAGNPRLQSWLSNTQASRGGATGGPVVTPAEQARFVQRVARAFQAAQSRDGEIQLRLSPPELGSLKLEVKVQGGVLTARLEAETATARTLLMDNLPVLRERLAEQGIQVEKFDVDLMDRQPQGEPDQSRDQHQERRGAPRIPGQRGERATEPAQAPTASRDVQPQRSNGRLNITV